MDRGLGRPGPTALQHRFTYIQPRAGSIGPGAEHPFGVLSTEHVDLATTEGWDVWAYTSLMRGAYDREDRSFPPPYHSGGNHRRLEALDRVAHDVGASRGQVVLAWLVGRPLPVWPVLGGSTIGQLESALAGVALELTPEQRELLDGAS